MKNTLKVLWMTAIVAVVGFSFASCLTFGGGGNGDDSQRWTGAMAPAEWPSLDIWEQYGVAGGLRQPSGTTVLIAHTATYAGLDVFSIGLQNANRAAFDDLVSQVERKGGWTVYERESSRREESISFVKGNNGLVLSFDVRENNIGIMATPNRED